MKNYWNNLNERERLMVVALTIFCFFYLYYVLLYAPLSSTKQERLQQLIEKQDTLIWMQQMQKEYHGKSTLKSITVSKLLTVLANQLNESTFKSYPYQLQQSSVHDIQLVFDKVPFNSFMTWLWSVNENYVLTIKQLNVQRTDIPGVVQLTLLLTVQ